MLEVEVVPGDGAVICRPMGTLGSTTMMTFRSAIAFCSGEPALTVDLAT